MEDFTAGTKPRNHCRPWDRAQDERLLRNVRRGAGSDDLCAVFGRTLEALRMRLATLAEAEACARGANIETAAWIVPEGASNPFQRGTLGDWMQYTRQQPSKYTRRATDAMWTPDATDAMWTPDAPVTWPASPPPTPPAASFATVRDAVMELAKLDRPRVRRLLSAYGAGVAAKLRPAQYAPFVTDCKAAIAEIKHRKAHVAAVTAAVDEAHAKGPTFVFTTAKPEDFKPGPVIIKSDWMWEGQPFLPEHFFVNSPAKEKVNMDSKFYIVYTPTFSVFSNAFSGTLSREEADTEAKRRAALDPQAVSYVLEAVSSTALGKVRTTAMKPAPKVKPVKPVKVKKGTPIEFV